MMKTILCLLLVLATAPAFAQPSGSGSGSGSGSAAPTAGSGSGSATPATGSGSATPAAGSGSAEPPMPDFPMPAGVKPTKVCLEEMDKDPEFADYIIKRTEIKLRDKVNAEQVHKDICTLRDHSDSQADVAKNKKHVLMAYIAMWLVAAGFVIFLWKKQQALKLEIANLRRDLDAATKDGK